MAGIEVINEIEVVEAVEGFHLDLLDDLDFLDDLAVQFPLLLLPGFVSLG